MHESVLRMWYAYLARLGHAPETLTPPRSFWHFCDNEQDADACAELVLRGKKTATAPSVWGLEARNEPLPEVGDLHVVTNWAGEAVCVIRTTSVEVVSFREVGPEHAAAEGEGDGSLAFWRRVHWDYYQRELEGTPFVAHEEMPVVCERFEVVHPSDR